MYTEYYGLAAKPFQLSPDPRFFFGSSGHRKALAYLRYGLSQGEGFIVITGGVGTGKTTLASSLFGELDPNALVAAQLVTTQVDADDVLRLAAGAFGVADTGGTKAEVLQALEQHLRAHAREGRRALLLVDEAQNLPPRALEELRMLSNFHVGDRPLIQSFLLGQEEFRTTLHSPGMEQLRQRVIATCHLAPLADVTESRGYIEHRLQVAGWRGSPAISGHAHAAIFRLTHGVPRRINLLCDRLLLYGFMEEIRDFDETHVANVQRELDQTAPAQPQQAPVPRAVAPARPVVKSAEPPGVDARMRELERAVAALADNRKAAADLKRAAKPSGPGSGEPIVDSLKDGFQRLANLVGKDGGKDGK